MIWPQRGCNCAAQLVAAELGLPGVGGSDAHSLATIGQAYTLFPGSSASDLYRAIVRGEVRWGGGYWSARQYLDLGRAWVRQRGVRGLLRVTLDGAGLSAAAAWFHG